MHNYIDELVKFVFIHLIIKFLELIKMLSKMFSPKNYKYCKDLEIHFALFYCVTFQPNKNTL